MSPVRASLGALGLLLAAYGGWLLLSRQSGAGHVATATWLATGVVLHDLVLAPLVVGLVALLGRVLPRAARAPVLVGVVVLGAVTLLGIPVLGRFGAKPDNPTLLDRDYGAGWLVLAALVLLGVVGATVTGAVRRRRRGGGA